MERTTRRPPGSRPTPPALLASSGFLFALIGSEMRRRFSELLAPFGLKPQHHGVLAYLAAYGPAAQVEVGHALGYDASDMVAWIDLLEQRGLVRRERDPADRRRYAVSLTTAGQEQFDRTMALSGDVANPLLASLDEADRRTLHDLLLRIAANVDAQLPRP